MKPIIEKLPLPGDHSFVARLHRTPHFEVPWHQHIEYELILFTEGSGLSFIGNYVGEFRPGDVFFLGSNLPHTFQKSNPEQVTSAIVIHFKEEFWGKEFLQLPESKSILKLLGTSLNGIKVLGKTKDRLEQTIKSLEKEKGFWRIIRLCECLAALAGTKEYQTVSTQEIVAMNKRDSERIERIFHYTMENFKETIQLSAIASVAGISVPAFCSYFKKRTKKTYIDFINEMRIGFACKQLLTTNTSILDICYDSGFNTVANFNRQFLKIKGTTPNQYRKQV
ncbi:MAG TPA: AraC family transcriptional regulator [Chitinophagaceae bacterium]|jgi:AraC-like DNA-binding protein/quercetin dioxygenase-like cupin family protein|nr:AraC family transcriptional regulator [Chitinophagaceae bacterium]